MVRKIAIGGISFAVSLPLAFLASELFFTAQFQVGRGVTPAVGVALVLIGAAVFWAVGCALSAIVLSISSLPFARARWAPAPIAVSVASFPWIMPMVSNRTLFIAQDHLTVAIAGLCTGCALAFLNQSRA